ncbi:MAG: hypothetical protein Q8N31_00970 [Reyranella sp.]|nr:hypothetical protein [Reyranella sp.]MDP3158559.1 hypothetical protein [Reyranella sp.]
MSNRLSGRMAVRILFAGIGFCALAVLGASAAVAGAPLLAALPEARPEETSSPDYTVFSPARTNTNIQGVVLACERGEGRPSLQLHVYIRNNDRLLPNDRPTATPKASPRASIDIDDQAFPSDLLFADRYAALSDQAGEDLALSRRLVAALLDGKVMVLRFDLLQETAGLPASFDGEATIPLTAQARSLSRTINQCVDPAIS